eukprot:361304-Chlamydomonas_euryale.AAC.3
MDGGMNAWMDGGFLKVQSRTRCTPHSHPPARILLASFHTGMPMTGSASCNPDSDSDNVGAVRHIMAGPAPPPPSHVVVAFRIGWP